MKRIVVLSLLALACVKPVEDPNAVAPTYERWQITVPKSQATVFDAAMRVLTDSSYGIADARKDAGLIRTRPRKASEVERGGKQVKTMLGTDYPITLNLVITPIGADSARIAVAGEYTMENIGATSKVNARMGEWRFVSGIGQAVLAAIR